MSSGPTVVHNAAARRFELVVDGRLCVCEYEDVGGSRVFTHTLVPPELRGRGLAELLVRAALAEARGAGRKVAPACAYVARFIERHAEYRDLLAAG